MARRTETELKNSRKAAWKYKEQWRSLLDDATEYAMPQRNLYDNPARGQRKGHNIFDNTLQRSSNKLATRMVNTMFPHDRDWGMLKAGPGVPESDRDKLDAALEKASRGAFTVINNLSNYHAAASEMALDLVISTGAMMIQPGVPNEPVIYHAAPNAQVAFEKGPYGRVKGVHRKWKLECGNIEGTWPDAKISDEMRKMIKDKPEKEILVEESTYWNDFEDGLAYYDVTIEMKKGQSSRIVERDMTWKPWVTPRMQTAANEVEGRGPVIQALPDVKTVDKLVELTLKNAALAVSGTYTGVDDGILNPNTARIKPGGVIPVKRNPGHPQGPSLSPLERAGDFNVAFMEYERITNAIKATMMNDDLPPLDGQPRTATEIIERVRQLSDDLGGAFGRLKTEWMIPVMNTTIAILDQHWGLIEIPNLKIDGVNVVFNVTSPLAQQQNIEEVQTIVQAIEMSNALFGPKITAMAFEMEKIPTYIANKLGVPHELIRDKPDQEQLQATLLEYASQLEGQSPGAGGQVIGEVINPQA